jgi:cytidine deaminase
MLKKLKSPCGVCRHRIQRIVPPDKLIMIDEGTVPFKGRVIF